MGSDHHKKHKKDKKKKKKRKHHDSQGTDEEDTVTSEPKIELPQSNKGNEKFITRFFYQPLLCSHLTVNHAQVKLKEFS